MSRISFAAKAVIPSRVRFSAMGMGLAQYVAIVAGGASAIDDPEPPGKEALVVFALP